MGCEECFSTQKNLKMLKILYFILSTCVSESILRRNWLLTTEVSVADVRLHLVWKLLCVLGYWSLSITLVESQARSWEESHQSLGSPTLQFTIREHGQSSAQRLSFPGSSRQRQFWEGQSHPKCFWHVQALINNPQNRAVFRARMLS